VGKECVWIPGKREPSWRLGGPALQKRERGNSWLQTAEERGRSNMATGAGDGLATTSRDVCTKKTRSTKSY
jgi:hypothetical protein